MVDCGNLRCFQERRSIKKDLLSWSKKVPVAVGLETIAEHFGSKRKIRKLFEPFNCLEDKEPHDWEPEENCFYCKGRIQLLFDAIEKTDSKDGSRILRDHPSLRHLGEILPFCPQFYTSNFGRDILIDIKSIQNEPEPPAVVPEPASKPNIELKIPTVSPSKQKKEVISSGKKGYSETELSAAVTDIRNGKLGTRRAASLYGIPRSTLRNKIFKLENDDSSVSAMLTDDDGDSNESVMPLKQPLHQQQQQQQTNKPENALQLSDLLQISTLQYLAPIAMPYMLKPDLSMLVENSEWERKLQHIRHKHNLSKASMNHYMEKALAHKLKPYQQELIRKLTHERLELEKNNLGHIPSHMIAGSRHDNTKSLTHSIILKALEQNSSPLKSPHQTKPSENGSLLDTTALSQSALMKALNMEPSLLTAVSSSLDSLSNIVVPAYKSSYHKGSKVKEEDMEKKSHKGFYKYENTRIGDTLKDIIIKTISEKVRCKLESTDFSGLVGTGSNLEKQKTKETLMSAFSIPDLCSPAKKIKQEVPDVESNKPHHNSHSSSSSSTQTKKTRPKRGQYRKYNSQLLTEAVKAVQRGEMSVHRAGSYYGVPHSTLEYKVKERHLLRQKKIKEQQEQKQKEAEEAKKKAEQVDSSTKASSEKNSSDTESSSPSKSFSGPSWLPPFVGASPFEGSASLGMFGSGFALSTPASELLRKLQHKVQSKSESAEETISDNAPYPTSSEGYIYIR